MSLQTSATLCSAALCLPADEDVNELLKSKNPKPDDADWRPSTAQSTLIAPLSHCPASKVASTRFWMTVCFSDNTKA